MKKIEMLFIRACRTSNPYKRICSVYRRFYCGEADNHITLILAGVVDKYFPIPMVRYYSLRSSQRGYNGLFDEKIEDWRIELNVLINHLRFDVDNEELEEHGYIIPLKYKIRDLQIANNGSRQYKRQNVV